MPTDDIKILLRNDPTQTNNWRLHGILSFSTQNLLYAIRQYSNLNIFRNRFSVQSLNEVQQAVIASEKKWIIISVSVMLLINR